MRRFWPVLFCQFLMLASACSTGPSERERAEASAFISGEASVVSVDQVLGQAVLDFEGNRINVFWQTEALLPRNGSMVRTDPHKPPVGHYQEPVVHAQKLDAKPGDRIQFSGLKMPGNEVLLRSVSVVAR